MLRISTNVSVPPQHPMPATTLGTDRPAPAQRTRLASRRSWRKRPRHNPRTPDRAPPELDTFCHTRCPIRRAIWNTLVDGAAGMSKPAPLREMERKGPNTARRVPKLPHAVLAIYGRPHDRPVGFREAVWCSHLPGSEFTIRSVSAPRIAADVSLAAELQTSQKSAEDE